MHHLLQSNLNTVLQQTLNVLPYLGISKYNCSHCVSRLFLTYTQKNKNSTSDFPLPVEARISFSLTEIWVHVEVRRCVRTWWSRTSWLLWQPCLERWDSAAAFSSPHHFSSSSSAACSSMGPTISSVIRFPSRPEIFTICKWAHSLTCGWSWKSKHADRVLFIDFTTLYKIVADDWADRYLDIGEHEKKNLTSLHFEIF